MLRDFFLGTRETLILLPKKNGKSTILAALGLFHLLSTPDADCIIVAASREQADVILKAARGFVRRSPALSQRLEVRKREIENPDLGGILKIRASDVDTVDGWIGTLGFIDELHRHKSPDLYGVIRDGLGPRKGRMVTISTAADDENSPLGRLRATAYTQPGLVRDGAYRCARTRGFVLHEWALGPEEDRDDLKLVKSANPAPWQTIEELRERHDSPSMTPWQWARFACGVWMAGEESAISDKEWRACARLGLAIPDGAIGVHVGIDLGWKWDTTALVPVHRPDGEQIVRVHTPKILAPPRDGTALAYDRVWEAIEEMAETWPEITFVLDPEAGGEQLAQQIDSELNARVSTHSQKNTPMALAASRLSEAISEGRIEHPDNAELNAHVLSAAPKQIGEQWRFVKPRRRKAPIDAVVALAMAHSVLTAAESKKPGKVAFF